MSADEIPGALPILEADGTPAAPEPAPEPKRPVWRRRRVPKGNVKAVNASMARTEALREATGRGDTAPQEWRTQLKAGERGKASSTLTRDRHTHNSGSGFGLA